ncbi:MAG: ABC transporter [Thermobacillus sp.]|uniref:YhgE/Pip domain-containing protein n=1 Tax=Thermobacillus sp. TaxID=2108467 RepID=UPI000E3B2DEE|nr:ABC transporter permease [Thermobacillus sp.]REK54087.1 MAG: ABC transporter [Thermobacillus sp.]
MKNALRALAKQPTTIIGIAAALLFQLIFTVVWMTGYDGMQDRTERLVIGIVNEDSRWGEAIVRQLKDGLPVRVRELDDPAEAARQLEYRGIQMLVRIPPDFSAKAAAADGTAALEFTINESNPMMIKNMMAQVAAQITASVNRQAIMTGARQMLSQLQMTEEQTRTMAETLSERVTADITYTNPVQGINNQMVPMMIVLASYVGVMIMGMNLEQSNMAAAAMGIGRWQRFGARMVINAAAAVIVSLIGVSLILGLGGQSAGGFFALWGFEALFILAFILVSQLFLMLFGMAGMLFNILLLSLQLVSSGAMMPRELLPDFYRSISEVFPATYAVEGAMNLLFGGPPADRAALGLLAILAAALLLGAASTAIRRPSVQAAAVKSPDLNMN